MNENPLLLTSTNFRGDYSLYSNIEFGFGGFSYRLSKDTVDQVEEDLGSKPTYTEALTLDGYIEIGYSYHKLFQSLYNAGLAFEVGLSLDLEHYFTMDAGYVKENDLVIEFERTDFRYGPIIRVTAVF